MYIGMFNNPQKAMQQTCHAYKKFGDIWILTAQDKILLVLPKHL